MPAVADIYVQRNEDWSRLWHLTDEFNDPIDVTGCQITMQVKSRTDNAAVIASGTINVLNATNGDVQLTLRASAGQPLSTFGSSLQTINLRYDVLLTYADGFHLPLVGGSVILSRGVTQP